MAVASASSSTKPLQSDSIFLSHSGGQKVDFVKPLYEALLSAKYQKRQVFFDMDTEESLPVGHDYPPRIFQACHDCKVAVIVLSEGYVKSLWPMLELQHLLLPSRPDRLIYPLFYQLNPRDLSDPAKLETWQECWTLNKKNWQIDVQKLQEQMSSTGSKLQIDLKIESWADNLSNLRWRSGSVRSVLRADHFKSNHEYIEEIVRDICSSFPPPAEYSLEPGRIVGQKRMQEEIDKVFQQEGSNIGGDGVGAIGVHGIGGIGKSTLCEMMSNYYRNEFPGRCFYLMFPSDDGDVVKVLLKAIRHTDEHVTNIDQAMGVLKERLRSKKFFLAIDNIWEHPHESYELAKRIIGMEFQPGTKIMLSSRGKGTLSSLLLERRRAMENMMMVVNAQSHPSVVHVPCLTEAEAMEALKYHHGCSAPEDCLLRLARSCFFKGQCHPLYLKLKGIELGQWDTSSFTNYQQWRNLISRLEVPGGNHSELEVEVWHCVEKSLKALPPRHRDIFIDLAATWPWSCLGRLGLPTFVRYHYEDCTEEDMYYNVLGKLRRHGLLEVEYSDPTNYWEDDDLDPYKIVIHDLLKHVAKQSRSLPEVHSVAKDAIIDEDLSVLSSTDDQLLEKKHVSGEHIKESTWRALFGNSTTSSSGISMLNTVRSVQIRSLFIEGTAVSWQIFGLHLQNNGRDLRALRVLHLQDIKGLREIEGWEGVPNLMVLSLSELGGLKRIGSIGCLTRLERLALFLCKGLELQALVGAGARVSLVKPGDQLPMLQHLLVQNCPHLTEVGPRLFDAFPALKVLKLRFCENLESFADLDSGKLQTLDLTSCRKLKSIEGISDSSLTALQCLVLEECYNLERISGISKVKCTDLRVLDATECAFELGNHLRLMMVGSCCGHHDNLLRVLSLPIRIPSEKYSMNGTDAVGGDEMNHELSGSSSFPALRLRDAVFSCSDNCMIVNEGMAQYFVHLQSLDITLEAEYPCWLDVSGLPHNLKKISLQVQGFESEHPCGLMYVSDLPKLERLTLWDFTSVKKLVISSSLVNLSFLNVSGFRAVEEISGLGAQLAKLFIQHCPLMEIILNANAQLPGLRELLLNGCSNREVPNLAAIAPSLENLRLVGWNSLTDASGVAGLTNLRSLELRNCRALRRIPNLRHLGAPLERLDIDPLDSPLMEIISDADAQLGPGLRQLSLSRCSNRELPNLAAIAPSLEILSLREWTSLTDVSGVAGLTNLRSLVLNNCTALRRIPNLRHLGALKRLSIRGPGSCWELRRKGDLQEMVSDGVHVQSDLYESFRDPAPRHGEAGVGCCGFFVWFNRSFIRLVFGVGD